MLMNIDKLWNLTATILCTQYCPCTDPTAGANYSATGAKDVLACNNLTWFSGAMDLNGLTQVKMFLGTLETKYECTGLCQKMPRYAFSDVAR